MKKKGVLVRLFSFMGLYKWFEVSAMLFVAVGAVISLYAYVIIYHAAKLIVQSVANPSLLDQTELSHIGKDVVIVICAGFGVYGLGLFLSHIAAFNTVAKLRERLVMHVGKLSMGYHSMNPSGKQRKIIEINTDNLENTIAHQIPDFIYSMVLPIAFIGFMFMFDWRLSIACLVPVIIGFVLLALMLKDSSKSFVEKQQKSAEDISNAATEYVRGISVVKAFGQTANSFKRYANSIKEYKKWMTDYAMSMRTADSCYNTIINGIFFFLIPTVICIYNATQSPKNLIFSFVFFCIIIPVTVTILTKIMGSSNKLMLCEASITAIENILEQKPLPQTKNPIVPKSYDIALENVTFKYTDNAPKALDNVSLSIPQGTVTALVGQSGGGKSTVANLIGRFYDVQEGKVTIGRIDIKDISNEWLANNVSIVFQSTNLFKLSIAENVAFTKENATREEIFHALKLAQCENILEKFPDGMDTVIGTKGVYLSGGEMQRIALARAILKDAPIVLLDEATAFADAENEYLIQKAFSELLKGKTVLMIAHRLSTVTDVDQICVIKDGMVAERGTHSQLISNNGAYANMYRDFESSISWKIGGKCNA